MLENPYYYNEDAKNERGFLRKVIAVLGALCFFLLFALAATWPTNAYPQEIPVHVVEHPQVRMQLLASRCTDPQSHLIIATAPPQFQEGWKAISSVWLTKDGTWQQFAGCWLEVPKEQAGTPENVMLLVFADGAVIQVLKSELLKKPGMPGV